jgi:hypothetical protein
MQKDSRYKWHHVLDIPDKERKDWYLYGEK